MNYKIQLSKMLQKAVSAFSIPSSEIKDRPEMKWK
jgi:hypothetical protein